MANIGMGEVLVLLVLALLVFGPAKLPEIAKGLGKGLRAFQEETQKASATLRKAVEEDTASRPGVVDRPDEMPAAVLGTVPPIATASAPAVVAEPEAATTPTVAPPPTTPLDVAIADPAEQVPGRVYEDT